MEQEVHLSAERAPRVVAQQQLPPGKCALRASREGSLSSSQVRPVRRLWAGQQRKRGALQ